MLIDSIGSESFVFEILGKRLYLHFYPTFCGAFHDATKLQKRGNRSIGARACSDTRPLSTPQPGPSHHPSELASSVRASFLARAGADPRPDKFT